MGIFSVRIAPGLRLSASPRGLRAHVGPRAARVHVGAGRPGVSTGAGPFGYYTSVGSTRRRAGTGYYPGPTRAQVAATAKEQQAEQIRAALAAIEGIHREEFQTRAKATAETPALPPYPVLLHYFEKQELRGIGIFDRAGRREARQRARALADQQAMAEVARAVSVTAARQAEIDAAWQQLTGNDPDVVQDLLNQAFEDNAAPTVAVGVEGTTASLVVLVPDPAMVLPDREVGITAAGNLSVKKATKKSLAEWYRELVAGHVIVSAVEAFAVAPGLMAVTVVACRRDGSLEPLLAADLSRESVSPEHRRRSRAWAMLQEVGDPVFRTKGQAGELVPLSLDDQPYLAALVEAFDGDEE